MEHRAAGHPAEEHRRAEHQPYADGAQQGLATVPAIREAERLLAEPDVTFERQPLCDEGLDRLDAVKAFQRKRLGSRVDHLRLVREPPNRAPERQHQRQHHRRNHKDGQAQPGAGQDHGGEAAGDDQDGSQHAQQGTDHGLDAGGVEHDLGPLPAGAGAFQLRNLLLDQAAEGALSDVGHDAIADEVREIGAPDRGGAVRQGQNRQPERRTVEVGRRSVQAVIDEAAEALTEQKHEQARDRGIGQGRREPQPMAGEQPGQSSEATVVVGWEEAEHASPRRAYRRWRSPGKWFCVRPS